jgi:transposase
MPKKIHRVAPEVKADAIRKIKEEGLTVSQAAKDYGVYETTVYGWLGAGAPKSTPTYLSEESSPCHSNHFSSVARRR